jgi:hypothetical protein
MAFCPTCGSAIDAGSTTCARCGVPPLTMPPPPAAPVYVTAPAPNAWQPGGFQQPGGGSILPDASPMALILAAAAWVVGCGPLLSIPAVIKARSDIRGIREGRYNPNSLSMSQIALWIGGINIVLSIVGLAILGLIFGAGFFFAATAPRHMPPSHAPIAIQSIPARSYESVEKDVEKLMSTRPESERKLWRETRDDLKSMRKQHGSGTLPEAKGLTALLKASESNEPLWTALASLERQAAQESGRVAPARPRPAGFAPAEAPPTGPPGEEDDDK